jgi:hypothetical protein
VIPSDAYVRFSAGRAAEVGASLHLTSNSFIRCCTYEGEPPILSVKDRHVLVTVTVLDRYQVTPATWTPHDGSPPRWRPTSPTWNGR